MIDCCVSVSDVAALAPAEQTEAAARLRRLLDETPETAGRDEIAVPHVTSAIQARAI